MFVIASDEQWVEIEGADLGFAKDPAILVPSPKKIQDFPGFCAIFFYQWYHAKYVRPLPVPINSVCFTRVNIVAIQSNAAFFTAQLYL